MAFLKKVFNKDAPATAPVVAPAAPAVAVVKASGPTYDEEPITECIEHLKVQKISAADAIADFDILLVCLAADFKARPELYRAIKKLAKDRSRERRNSNEVKAPQSPDGPQSGTPRKKLTRTTSVESLRQNSNKMQYRSPFDDEDDDDDAPPPPPPKSSRRQKEIEKMKEEWRRKMRGEMTEEDRLKEEWRRKMRGEMTEEERLKEEWRKKMRGETGSGSASAPVSTPTTPQLPRAVSPAPSADGTAASTGGSSLVVPHSTNGAPANAQPSSAGGSAISGQSTGSTTPSSTQPSPRPGPIVQPQPLAARSQSDRQLDLRDASAAHAASATTAQSAATATAAATAASDESAEKREKKEKKREKKERKRKEAEAAAAAAAAAPSAPAAASAPSVPSITATPAATAANATTAAPATVTPVPQHASAPASVLLTTVPPPSVPSAASAPTNTAVAAPPPVGRDKSPFGRSKDRITRPPVEQMMELAKHDDPNKFYGDRARIGKGGFGDVYLANDLRQKKSSKASQVAIKVSREKMTNTMHAELIANEILLLSQCRHKNIVNYLECYHFRERIWMVMEYCDGGSLTQLYKGVALNEMHFSYVIKSVLLGLQYLHDQNRLHRDIKGDNILLNMDGEVKIADLGLAAEAEDRGSGLVGSRYWMSPEMIKREGYDFKTDIWSTGCVLIEMCNLEPPYHEYRSMKALFKIATKGAAPLKNPESFSAPLKSFLATATQFRPEERPDAAELMKHPWIVKSGKKDDMMKATEVVFLGNSLRMNGF